MISRCSMLKLAPFGLLAVAPMEWLLEESIFSSVSLLNASLAISAMS